MEFQWDFMCQANLLSKTENKGFSGVFHQHIYRTPRGFLENPKVFHRARKTRRGFLEKKKTPNVFGEKPFPRENPSLEFQTFTNRISEVLTIATNMCPIT
jgi:hypothetical protein